MIIKIIFAGKLDAEDFDQEFTCNVEKGFECYNLKNSEDCYDYEVSFFCACEGTTPYPSRISTPCKFIN